MESVNEMQSSLMKKAGGVSEQARKAILEDIKHKIEEGRASIKNSIEVHTKAINSTLDEIITRVEELKTCPVSDSGELINGVKL